MSEKPIRDGKYECGGIVYELERTATGLPPDSNTQWSLNIQRLFIRIQGDDKWYHCDDNITNTQKRIEKMGSPLAYILSMGYNEVYHFLYRQSEKIEDEEDPVKNKMEQMIKQIEDIDKTCKIVES